MPAIKLTTTAAALEALLHAAELTLSARQDHMLTDEEWDGLAAAVTTGRKVMPRVPTDPVQMLDTLAITKIDRQGCSGGGSWVSGRIAGHRFEALVFPEHAERESYELNRSRISKLWLKDMTSGQTVANFERGWDVRPTTDNARQIVDLLAAGLAETVFGK